MAAPDMSMLQRFSSLTQKSSSSEQRWLMCNAAMQSGAQALNSFYFNHLFGYFFVLIELVNHDVSVH